MDYHLRRLLRAIQALIWPQRGLDKIIHHVIIFGMFSLLGISLLGNLPLVLDALNLHSTIGVSGWTFTSIAFLALALSLALRVAQHETPCLSACSLQLSEDRGKVLVKVVVESCASLKGVNARIERIDCRDDMLQQISKIEVPIPIYTQERQIERRQGVHDDPVRPNNFKRGESKAYEIFEIEESQIFLSRAKVAECFIALEWLAFRCNIFCDEGPPLAFSVIYEDRDLAGKWQVGLVGQNGKIVDTKKSWTL